MIELLTNVDDPILKVNACTQTGIRFSIKKEKQKTNFMCLNIRFLK